jgi:hypothetical protein
MDSLTIDYTSLATANKCLRQYYWRFVRHLVPDEPESTAVVFGKKVHDIRRDLAAGRKNLTSHVEEYEQFFASHVSANEALRTPQTLKEVMALYLERYHPIKDIYTEVGFAVEASRNVLFVGRIDYVTEIDGKWAVIDLKTTGSLAWLPHPKLNWQLIGYAYALHTLSGKVPSYVGIDGIVLTKKLNPDSTFHLRISNVTARDFEEWEHWMSHWVGTILFCLKDDWWPMAALNGCKQFGECPYAPLCKAPSKEIEENLLRNYREERWFPYERETDE